MNYSKYSHLLDKNYSQGNTDCFSILMEFYNDIFGIEIPNYARPDGYFLPHIDLIPKIAADLGLKTRALSRIDLRDGDILTFRVASEYTNHVGIYVGNNSFIHHITATKSREDNLDQRWFRRLTGVYYMEDVQAQLPINNAWFEVLLKDANPLGK